MALTKTKSVIVPTGNNAPGATTRGTLDVSNKYGGIVTMKMQNGSPGPTVQCECRVLISHEDTLPAAGGTGTNWKVVYRYGGGIVPYASSEQSFVFGPEVRHIEVEFDSNTGQPVLVEAIATTYTV